MSQHNPQPAQPEREANVTRLLPADPERLGRITVQLATGMAMTLGCRPPRNGDVRPEA